MSSGDGVAPLPPILARVPPSRSLSFHESVDAITPRAPEGATARASRLRATTSAHFKTMLNPQNRSMLRRIEKQKADQKLQAKQLADLHRELERKARVIDATIFPADLTERGPLSSSGAQGEVFKAVWKRMIPVAIKENKSGEWAGDLTAEMQLFLDLHHPHVVACYGILKETGADGQVVNSIVTEKCSTSLDHFLKDNDNWTCFKGSDCLNHINLQKSTILLHISQGLEKLHDMNVLHRDIKCGIRIAPWHCCVRLVHY
jgi:signal recognition particle subunit SEC65